MEAYRTLRTRLVKQQTRNGARSLIVTSAAQGEGKTLTTFNLAICYAKIENWPVLVVDADLRTRGLSILAGDPESPGLAEILEKDCPYQSARTSDRYSRASHFACRRNQPSRLQSCFPASAGKSSWVGRPNLSAWFWWIRLQR